MALVALDTAIWWLATTAIAGAIPRFIAQAAQSGWRIETGGTARGGWPFSATVTLERVSTTRSLGGTTIAWRVPRVAVTLSLWEPRTAMVSPAGAQELVIGAGPALPLQADEAIVRIPLEGGTSRFDLRAVDAALPSGLAIHVAHLTGEAEALAVGVTADGVTISPALPPPFDGQLALSGGAHLTTGFPDAATPGASALAWHRAGGQVDVPAITLQWGPLHITGSGSGGLDAQLQPAGRARLEVAGAAEVLDAAGRAGMLASGPEAAARAVLGLLALAAQGRPVPIRVTLADRTLTVAQFPLARLPMLNWDQP